MENKEEIKKSWGGNVSGNQAIKQYIPFGLNL